MMYLLRSTVQRCTCSYKVKSVGRYWESLKQILSKDIPPNLQHYEKAGRDNEKSIFSFG